MLLACWRPRTPNTYQSSFDALYHCPNSVPIIAQHQRNKIPITVPSLSSPRHTVRNLERGSALRLESQGHGVLLLLCHDLGRPGAAVLGRLQLRLPVPAAAGLHALHLLPDCAGALEAGHPGPAGLQGVLGHIRWVEDQGVFAPRFGWLSHISCKNSFLQSQWIFSLSA